MDRIERYRSIIKQAITDSPYYRFLPKGIETLFVCDEEKMIYLLYDIGWQEDKHYSTLRLLVRIKNGKIWIDEDWTEEGIATEFLKAGVPKEDIVLAFHHPSLRELTDFAVA